MSTEEGSQWGQGLPNNTANVQTDGAQGGSSINVGTMEVSYGNLEYLVKPYSGNRNDIPFADFMDTFKEVYSVSGWPAKIAKLVLKSKLKGLALEYFHKDIVIRSTDNIDIICNILQTRFGTKTSSKEALDKLLHIRQHISESIYDYANRLHTLRDQVSQGEEGSCVTETFLRKLFLDGLSDNVRLHMVGRCPMSLNETIQLATAVQCEIAQIKPQKTRVLMSRGSSADDTLPDDHDNTTPEQDQIVMLTREIAKLKTQMQSKDSKKERDTSIRRVNHQEKESGRKRENRVAESGPASEVINSKGQTSMVKHGLLSIEVIINGTKIKALLDTCATTSIVSLDLVNKLGMERQIEEIKPQQIIGLGHAIMDSIGLLQILFSFSPDKKSFAHGFMVVDLNGNEDVDMILAIDFLIRYDGVIDIPHRTLTLGLCGTYNCSIVSQVKSVGLYCIVREINSEEQHKESDQIPTYFCRETSTDSKKICRLKELVANAEIPTLEKGELLQLLLEYEDCFAMGTADLGLIKKSEFRLEVTQDKPINSRQYPIPVKLKSRVLNKLNEFLDAGVLERSTSPWNCPLIIREKPNGEVRLVLDASGVNGITRKIDYPLVRVDEALHRLSGSKWFTILDLECGYHQVPLHPDSRKFFAFRTPWGKYQYKRLPMGASNSAFHFQSIMERMIQTTEEDGVVIFQDDILIASADVKTHLQTLGKVLKSLAISGATVKISKCHIGRAEAEYLGHTINAVGFLPKQSNICDILEFSTPKSRTQVRKFMGTINFYAKFLPNLAQRAATITDLLQSSTTKFKWSATHEDAFQAIKHSFSDLPLLTYPSYDRPFIIKVTVSDRAMAAVLGQRGPAQWEPIGYFSRKFKRHETAYSNLEKHALISLAAMDHFRRIVYGFPITIEAHGKLILGLNKLQETSTRIVNWSHKILKYSPIFVIEEKQEDPLCRYNPDIGQDKVDTENLSDENDETLLHEVVITDSNASAEPASIKDTVDIIDVTQWKVAYTDGSCVGRHGSERRAGIGVFWEDEAGKSISSRFTGKQTNNVAELRAIIQALKQAHELAYSKIIIKCDSKYAIESITRYLPKWKANHWTLPKGKTIINKDLFAEIDTLLETIEVRFEHISGHTNEPGNSKAHELAVLATTDIASKSHSLIIPVSEAVNTEKSYVVTSKEISGIKPITLEEIKEAQRTCELTKKMIGELTAKRKKEQIAQGVKPYLREDGTLWMKGNIGLSGKMEVRVDAPLIPHSLRKKILVMLHNDRWSGHSGYDTMTRELLSQYFWPNFRKDIRYHISNCTSCQKSIIPRGQAPIQDFTKPTRPFQQVAIDLLGPLSTTTMGYKYIVNIIDIFSRYLIAVPLIDQRASTVIKALESHLIAKHGCPDSILSDRGTNLTSESFHQFCTIMGMKHKLTGPWRPQTNGMVERVNKTLKSKLAHLCTDSRELWDENLPMATFSYNTAIHSATGRSPAEAVFGYTIKRPPVAVTVQEIKTSTVSQYCEEIKRRALLIHEEMSARDKIEQSNRNSRLNNKRRMRELTVNDKVWYREPRVGKTRLHGFKHPMAGPYRVIEKVSPVSYIIESVGAKGRTRQLRVHIDRLRKYEVDEDYAEQIKTTANIDSYSNTMNQEIRRHVEAEENDDTNDMFTVKRVRTQPTHPTPSTALPQVNTLGTEAKKVSVTDGNHQYNLRSKTRK